MISWLKDWWCKPKWVCENCGFETHNRKLHGDNYDHEIAIKTFPKNGGDGYYFTPKVCGRWKLLQGHAPRHLYIGSLMVTDEQKVA